MSGLEKFEASKSWRSNLKNFLFIKRKPPVNNPVSLGDTQRCSLDVSEDLQTLIRERKAQIELEKQTTTEFLPSNSEPSSAKMSRLTPHFDDTCLESNQPLVENVSDESFEALERMCDKTASDPNSTLFQYMHSNCKEEIMADAKKRSTGEGNIVGDVDETHLVAKISECTLLDDIEAPSRIWDNTIVGETGLFKTSPVKMVGLLRPSTIMEEAGDESVNSDKSSQMSFQSVAKGLQSDVSSTYDTALESTVTSTRTDDSSKQCKEEVYVDDILQLAIERTRALDGRSLLLTPLLVSESDGISEPENRLENISVDKSDISIDLIDLENTFGPLHNSPHLSVLGEIASDVVIINDDEEESDSNGSEVDDILDEKSDESIIDILSDAEEETQENLYSYVAEESKNGLKSKCDSSDVEKNAFEDNKENLTRDSLPGDRSLNFNDTMEEVEYMLKKGMEYMASKEMQSVASTKCAGVPEASAQILTKKQPLVNQAKPNYPVKPHPKATIQLRTCRTQPNSPSSNPRNATSSAKKVKESYFKTPAEKIQTTSEVSTVGIRPFPKFDVFGGRSPKSVAIHPRQKELCRKQPFSHIVSPVGAYMKNTASTPLMSTAKMKNTNTNVMNSTAFRELEIESRLYEAKFVDGSPRTQYESGLSELPGLTGVPNTLPKKAYISSELKHIVDKRTPITIPGGKKIQKYLENAMMPAVLRHDGKMKFPGAPNVTTINTNPQLPAADAQTMSNSPSVTTIDTTLATTSSRRNNASFRDLSLMSGDVSLYTIMDAQKF